MTAPEISRTEFNTLKTEVQDIKTVMARHETRLAVRAESDKLIDTKFAHLESKMDTQFTGLTKQTDALKNVIVRVALAFGTGSTAIIIGVVAFVLTGVVKVG